MALPSYKGRDYVLHDDESQEGKQCETLYVWNSEETGQVKVFECGPVVVMGTRRLTSKQC